MKILITGAGGQLARALASTAPPKMTLRAVNRAQCDISQLSSIQKEVGSFEPDVVINTAAYTAVDAAEDNEDLAFEVNARGAENVAKAAEIAGSRVIHISTDYVFDGERSTPYPPDALAHPLSVYGASKLAGEEAVRRESPDALIVRSGWIYSMSGKNFLLRILELLRGARTLRVVADQRGTPTWAEDLAEILWLCATRRDVTGTYHFANAGEASWYEFASEIRTLAVGQRPGPPPPDIIPVTSQEYGAPAIRPRYSVLDSALLLRLLHHRARSWEIALRSALSSRHEGPSL